MTVETVTVEFDDAAVRALIEEARENSYLMTANLAKVEWLCIRKNLGIGASEVGAMMGLSQYKTAFQVWAEKVSETITDIDSPAMKRGRMLEQTVADMYAEESGRTIRMDNKIRIHPTHIHVFASLDRTIVDNGDGNGPGVLECKTVTAYAMKAWESEIPMVYFVQLQQQLAVTGWTWGEIALLNIDTFELHRMRFERDEAIISTILAEIENFWMSYVVPEIEPPMVAADFTKYYRQDESPVTATDDIKIVVSNLTEVKEKIKEMESLKESLEVTVKEFIGKANILTDADGSIVATWKTQSKKAYEVKASTSRVLRIKKQSTGE